MTRHILLDSYPLGALSSPKPIAGIFQWIRDCQAAGHEIYVPEVIDYELRRELLRAQKTNSVIALDGLGVRFNFLAINSAAILLAADLWATSRRSGLPTADPKKLDVDVILAAQALTLSVPRNSLIVATSNVRHLARFVPADLWENITP